MLIKNMNSTKKILCLCMPKILMSKLDKEMPFIDSENHNC